MQWSEIRVTFTHESVNIIYRAIQIHIYKQNEKVPKILFLYIKFSY